MSYPQNHKLPRLRKWNRAGDRPDDLRNPCVIFVVLLCTIVAPLAQARQTITSPSEKRAGQRHRALVTQETDSRDQVEAILTELRQILQYSNAAFI
jgi:hypothetical protein